MNKKSNQITKLLLCALPISTCTLPISTAIAGTDRIFVTCAAVYDKNNRPQTEADCVLGVGPDANNYKVNFIPFGHTLELLNITNTKEPEKIYLLRQTKIYDKSTDEHKDKDKSKWKNTDANKDRSKRKDKSKIKLTPRQVNYYALSYLIGGYMVKSGSLVDPSCVTSKSQTLFGVLKPVAETDYGSWGLFNISDPKQNSSKSEIEEQPLMDQKHSYLIQLSLRPYSAQTDNINKSGRDVYITIEQKFAKNGDIQLCKCYETYFVWSRPGLLNFDTSRHSYASDKAYNTVAIQDE